MGTQHTGSAPSQLPQENSIIELHPQDHAFLREVAEGLSSVEAISPDILEAAWKAMNPEIRKDYSDAYRAFERAGGRNYEHFSTQMRLYNLNERIGRPQNLSKPTLSREALEDLLSQRSKLIGMILFHLPESISNTTATEEQLPPLTYEQIDTTDEILNGIQNSLIDRREDPEKPFSLTKNDLRQTDAAIQSLTPLLSGLDENDPGQREVASSIRMQIARANLIQELDPRYSTQWKIEKNSSSAGSILDKPLRGAVGAVASILALMALVPLIKKFIKGDAITGLEAGIAAAYAATGTVVLGFSPFGNIDNLQKKAETVQSLNGKGYEPFRTIAKREGFANTAKATEELHNILNASPALARALRENLRREGADMTFIRETLELNTGSLDNYLCRLKDDKERSQFLAPLANLHIEKEETKNTIIAFLAKES